MQQILVRNRQAALLWGICLVVFALMVFVTSQVSVGRVSSPLEAGGLLVGWFVVVVFCGTGLKTPCETATITQGGCVTFTWQYPVWRVRKSFDVAQIGAPVVVKTLDSDGDAHYTAQVELPDGSVFVLMHSAVFTGNVASSERHKARCEASCVRFSEGITQAVG